MPVPILPGTGVGDRAVEDLTLEFDVLERGRLVHDVLAMFHRRVNDRLGRPASPLELDAGRIRSLWPPPRRVAAAGAGNPVQAALAGSRPAAGVEWLWQYRGQCENTTGMWQDFEAPLAPELFEVSFGRGDEPPPSTDQPLESTRRGKTVRISGRIDRIDTGIVAGHTVFNVLDYKTGGSIGLTPESIRAGTTLQLPLYAIAAMELLLADRDAVPGRPAIGTCATTASSPRQALQMYRNDDGRIELEPEWEEIPRRSGRHRGRPGPRHPPRPVSRVQRRRALHRPLPLQHRLPHQSGSFVGEDMPADGEQRPSEPHPALTDQQQRAIDAPAACRWRSRRAPAAARRSC